MASARGIQVVAPLASNIQHPPTEEAEGTIVDCGLRIRAEKTRMGGIHDGGYFPIRQYEMRKGDQEGTD